MINVNLLTCFNYVNYLFILISLFLFFVELCNCILAFIIYFFIIYSCIQFFLNFKCVQRNFIIKLNVLLNNIINIYKMFKLKYNKITNYVKPINVLFSTKY